MDTKQPSSSCCWLVGASAKKHRRSMMMMMRASSSSSSRRRDDDDEPPSKRRRSVHFSTQEPAVHHVESMKLLLSEEEKSNLWMQRSEIALASQRARSAIEECLQDAPAGTIQYIRTVVATYIACTPVNENNNNNENNNEAAEPPEMESIHEFPSLLAACPKGVQQKLRGLETHLSSDMAQERARRRSEYTQGLVQLHRMLEPNHHESPFVLATMAKRCSRSSRRLAVVVGAADALSLQEHKEEEEECREGVPVPAPEDTTRCAVVPPSA